MQDRNLVYQWAYNQRTHRPDEIVGKTDADLFAPEDVPAILETKRRVIESGTPVHVAHWLTSNGQRIFLDLHYEPLRNPAGEITGIGIAAVNLTAQKRTEEALLQSRNQFRVLTQNIDAGVALVDEHGQFAIVNPVFLRLFDLPDGSSIKNVNDCDWVKWQVFEENGELVHVDEHPVRKAVLTNRAVRDRLVGVKTPSGASLKWMLISAEPILRADGHMEALICTYLDITDRKRAEESLRDALREKEVLLKEVHHRVKNNMQVLASLVSLQADAVGDPATRALFDDFRDQVRTMAQVHESLYQSENLTSIAFDEFANGLTTNLARTHSRGDAAIRLTLDVEPVTLPIESAVPCGLILNELVTNAYKHAFRGRDAGEIVVSLRADAAGRVCLGVYDNGVGLPAGLDWQQSTTLGLRLVQILARQVRGEFDICVEHGTVFQLAFTPPTPKAP
jgi:PAS domain S-box-containing protein